jgi:hypothetical protein
VQVIAQHAKTIARSTNPTTKLIYSHDLDYSNTHTVHEVISAYMTGEAGFRSIIVTVSTTNYLNSANYSSDWQHILVETNFNYMLQLKPWAYFGALGAK